MTSDPSAIYVCSGDGKQQTQTVFIPGGGAYTVCTGTPGNSLKRGLIPNNEDVETRQYINFYNNAIGTASLPRVANPCITSQGVPGPGSTFENVTGFVTSAGCCSRPRDWNTHVGSVPVAPPGSSLRSTQLQPFSTASAPGAQDCANMVTGVPENLLGLTKIWGCSAKWAHGGTHADNVGAWFKDIAGLPFNVNYNGKTWQQDVVLWCRMTGDAYNPALDPYGTVYPAPAGNYVPLASLAALDNSCKGCDTAAHTGQLFFDATVGDATQCHNAYIQGCNQQPLTEDVLRGPSGAAKGFNKSTGYGYSDPRGRVGGCFGSRDMFGPGKFSVLINLPPTALPNPDDHLVEAEFPNVDPFNGKYGTDTSAYQKSASGPYAGGRGYVFSMWTFSYTEAYLPPDATYVSPYEVQPTASGQQQTLVAQDGILQAAAVQFPFIKGIQSGTKADGFYVQHNHEIDIEIPANSGPVVDVDSNAGGYANQKKNLGMNTANFNTWLSDTDNDSYDAGTATLYQQTQATAPEGQFFASVGPSETDEDYHEFSYVWYVDPDEAALPPSATTTPKSYVAFLRDGLEIFRSHRFIPRRAGRVIIGLWPAWWGSMYNPLTFNHVYAKIARIDFQPQTDGSGPRPSLVTNAPQMYDQILPTSNSTAAEVKCGYETDIYERRACAFGDGTKCETQAPVPFRPSTPAPAPSKPGVPAPAPFRPGVPAPAPFRPSVPAPASFRPRAPAPAPFKPSVPAPTPLNPNAPAPPGVPGLTPLAKKSSDASNIPLWGVIAICIAAVGLILGIISGIQLHRFLKANGSKNVAPVAAVKGAAIPFLRRSLRISSLQ